MATMRIHFTAEDLARVRLAATDPVTETLFGFRYLLQRCQPELFQQWRRDVRARLSGNSRVLMLAPLFPPQKLPFDLYTLCGRPESIGAAAEILRIRTRERLTAEVAFTDTEFTMPDWARHIAVADRDWIDRLATAVRAAHQAIVDPYWPQIQAHLTAERADHGRRLLGFGVEYLLAHLHPTMRWRYPVLEFPSLHDVDRPLGGRGLIVIFSMFCSRPLSVRDYSDGFNQPPEVWLYVPATSAPDALLPPESDWAADERALATLLGRTRAAVLRAVAAGPMTTSGLARHVGISIPAASQQAGVLRDAGLIVTHRAGKAVLHTTTATGEALLAGSALTDPPAHPRPCGSLHRSPRSDQAGRDTPETA